MPEVLGPSEVNKPAKRAGNYVKEGAGPSTTWWPGLPSNLFVAVIGVMDGGWPHRILWDIYHFSDSPEVETSFTRLVCANGTCQVGPLPELEEHGQFDQVGHLFIFRDIVQSYIGGNAMKSNPVVADPQSEWYYDDRGFAGLDSTEFIDGLVCRGGANHQDVEKLVRDVMDFQLYFAADAPTSCP